MQLARLRDIERQPNGTCERRTKYTRAYKCRPEARLDAVIHHILLSRAGNIGARATRRAWAERRFRRGPPPLQFPAMVGKGCGGLPYLFAFLPGTFPPKG